MKRIIDIFGAIVGIVLFSPLMLVLGVLIKCSDSGPILFKHKRLGQNGQEFYLYKFRTMVMNAEQVLRNNKELYHKYVRESFSLAIDTDPRITKLGRFLRRTSLDELPQFINILKGEMSLVGPRPVIQEEIKHYGDDKAIFLSIKPGLTGYWQAYGRDDITYPARVEVEMYYVNNHNLYLDLKIILRTIASVLFRHGVH